MKYKPFREQFKECKENGTVELFDTQKPEKVYVRPNTKGIKFIEVKRIYFCNKYMRRCTSGVCAKERGIKNEHNTNNSRK